MKVNKNANSKTKIEPAIFLVSLICDSCSSPSLALSLSLPRCIDQLGESCSPIMQIEVDKQQQAWYAAVCNDAIYRFL